MVNYKVSLVEAVPCIDPLIRRKSSVRGDSKNPMVTWRSGANLLYSNWLNFIVYQDTPYDIHAIEPFQKIKIQK